MKGFPCIRESVKRTDAQKLVVVADAGMLNKDNLTSLESGILKHDKTGRRFTLSDTQTLLITFSTKRAAKNRADRKKQVEKVKKALAVSKYIEYITL